MEGLIVFWQAFFAEYDLFGDGCAKKYSQKPKKVV
jgi:hypothetical protein